MVQTNDHSVRQAPPEIILVAMEEASELIYPRLALSRKRRLPILAVGDSTYLPHQYLSKFLPLHEWSLREWGEIVVLEHKGTRLRLLKNYAKLLFNEWGLWNEYYLPAGLEGKTVLDAGAGCGEVTYLYLMKGAKRVICVETDADAARCLRENAQANHWNVEIEQRPFETKMITDYGCYMVKIDIEGGEAALLDWNGRLPAGSIIEIHGSDLREKLSRKWGNLETLVELEPGHWDRVFLDRVSEAAVSSNRVAKSPSLRAGPNQSV